MGQQEKHDDHDDDDDGDDSVLLKINTDRQTVQLSLSHILYRRLSSPSDFSYVTETKRTKLIHNKETACRSLLIRTRKSIIKF